MDKIYNFERDAKASRQWIVTAFFAALIFWGFGYDTVWTRLSLQVSGTIVSRHYVPYEGAPRYATEYLILGEDGKKQIYSASGTDASLQRNMAVGARVDKQWGELDYRVNDQWIKFPKMFYCIALLVGVAVSILSLTLWRRQHR